MSVFAKVNSFYVMTYKRNNSLRVSTGPGIAFEPCQVIRTESEHKNLLLSCHVTCLMAPSRTKPCLTTHHLRVSEKALYLALLRSMDYHERQRSKFIRVSGLQKVTQELRLRLHLEMVDVHSRFRLNCIKTYVNCVRAQSFINYTSNTIP